MEVDHVIQDGNRFSIQALYEFMRKEKVNWPGQYLQKLRDRSDGWGVDVIDEYLGKWDIAREERWAG